MSNLSDITLKGRPLASFEPGYSESQPSLTELGRQFFLCCSVAYLVHGSCQQVFCLAKSPIHDPLTRENTLLLGLFWDMPIGVSVLLTSPALTLG